MSALCQKQTFRLLLDIIVGGQGCSSSWSITVNLPRRKFLHLTAGTAALPVAAVLLALLTTKAVGQPAAVAPPAVGVVRAERQQITETDEFIGRIQAVNRVALVARVTGFLEKRLFTEGAEVKKGDPLYEIEKPPFQAAVDAAQSTVEQ